MKPLTLTLNPHHTFRTNCVVQPSDISLVSHAFYRASNDTDETLHNIEVERKNGGASISGVVTGECLNKLLKEYNEWCTKQEKLREAGELTDALVNEAREQVKEEMSKAVEAISEQFKLQGEATLQAMQINLTESFMGICEEYKRKSMDVTIDLDKLIGQTSTICERLEATTDAMTKLDKTAETFKVLGEHLSSIMEPQGED